MERKQELEVEEAQFQECAACAAKRGSPDLCTSCYENRRLIERLRESNSRLRRRLGAAGVMNDALMDHIAERRQ